MRRIGRFTVLLAVSPLLIAATACGEDEAKPPPPGAKLCGATMASWWFDATGANDLSGRLTGGLPLANPTQTENAVCRVSSGGKLVGAFAAEVTTADRVINSAAQIADRPADSRFTVAGGKGMAEPTNDGGAEAWWTCKNTLLNVEVHRPKDVKKRVELTKTLGARVAAVVGCPGPVPVLPSD